MDITHYKTLEEHLDRGLTFPLEVHLESSSYCNAHCIMCPRGKINRPLGFLDAKLFDKATEETSDYEMDYIHLHLNGEPMFLQIDELVRRINRARERNPKCKYICMFTNASLLTPDKADKILNSKLDVLMVSIHAGNREDYERVMRGLSWDTLIKNMTYFMAQKEKVNPRLYVQTGFIPQKENQWSLEEYYKIFRNMGVNDAGGGGVNNIGGMIPAKDMRLKLQYTKGVIDEPCMRLFNDLSIMSDGRACVCSQDVAGVMPVGNLHYQTLKDIWQGKELTWVRDMFVYKQKSKIPFCGECDYMEGCVSPNFWHKTQEEWERIYEDSKNRAYKR